MEWWEIILFAIVWFIGLCLWGLTFGNKKGGNWFEGGGW